MKCFLHLHFGKSYIKKKLFQPFENEITCCFPSIMRSVVGEQYLGNDSHAVIYMCNAQLL